MKYTLYLVCAALILQSCTGNKTSDDSKIKESITTYLTTGVEKKDMLKIDSIGIASIDTLTQKNILKISLDRNYNVLKSMNAIYESKLDLIKADSALLGMMRMQKTMYEKHGEKYDDASLKQQAAKMNTDSADLVQSRGDVEKIKLTIDSIEKVYTNADSTSFAAYFVGATVYLHGGEGEPGNYIVSKDWKVSR